MEFVWDLNFGLNLFVGLNLELNLWACRFELFSKKATQRVARHSRSKNPHCHFELSQKAKNPHFKGANLCFKFVDTSLRSV